MISWFHPTLQHLTGQDFRLSREKQVPAKRISTGYFFCPCVFHLPLLLSTVPLLLSVHSSSSSLFPSIILLCYSTSPTYLLQVALYLGQVGDRKTGLVRWLLTFHLKERFKTLLWELVGVSLSETHTSGTALWSVCVCLFACGHIP